MFCVIVKEIVGTQIRNLLSARLGSSLSFEQFSFDSMVVRFSKLT